MGVIKNMMAKAVESSAKDVALDAVQKGKKSIELFDIEDEMKTLYL